ncbi:glycosyltransferase family 4 protein [Neoroseomonas rubea]|uniref:glycosyltransferase family 4 protein n=1 Tax=Neoroseomonas rubea TaxID=2748666 RepID=UPI0018DF43BE
MRIALTSPYCWPQRRRGSERLLHDLSHWFAARGHDVTVIATAPGERRVEADGPVRRILLPQRGPLGLDLRALNFFHRFAFQVEGEIAADPPDAVLALNYHDAWGVLRARRRGARTRLVYQAVGIPVRRYFRRIPLDGWMFRQVLRGAEEVLTISRFAGDLLASEFGRDSRLLHAPTDLAPLLAAPKPPPDGTLRLLFAADLNEPRKGALLLARAFARVAAARPGARLDYSGHADAAIQAAIRAAVPQDLVPAITFHGVGAVGDLPALYARATVFVLPAIWEAQGMVLVEALAAGTPVVACDHGGVGDIVDDPAIGRLCPPGPIRGHAATDDAALAEAILAAADLAAQPGTDAACRARAAAFGLDRLGPIYEACLAGEGAAQSGLRSDGVI